MISNEYNLQVVAMLRNLIANIERGNVAVEYAHCEGDDNDKERGELILQVKGTPDRRL